MTKTTIRDLFVLFDGSVADAIDGSAKWRPGPLQAVVFEQPLPPVERRQQHRWFSRDRHLSPHTARLLGIPETTPTYYRVVIFSLAAQVVEISLSGYTFTFEVAATDLNSAAGNLGLDLVSELEGKVLQVWPKSDSADARLVETLILTGTKDNDKIAGISFHLFSVYKNDSTRPKQREAGGRQAGAPVRSESPHRAVDLDRLLASQIRAEGEDGLEYRYLSEKLGEVALGTISKLDRKGSGGDFSLTAKSTRHGAIWTSGGIEEGEALRSSIQELLRAYGLLFVPDGPPQKGSWWQRFRVIVRNTAKQQNLPGKMEEVEQGLRAHYLDNQTAQNDNLKADAVGKVLAQLGETDEAVIVLGQLVMVKHHRKLVVKSVDALTAAKIERTKTLLSDPGAVIKMLSTIGSEEPQPSLYAQQARAALQQPPEPPPLGSS